MASTTKTATIYDSGRGFPNIGDYVPGYDGALYRVAALGQRNKRSRAAGYIAHCRVLRVEWDVPSIGAEAHPSRCAIEDAWAPREA